jgi:hypothetical protein
MNCELTKSCIDNEDSKMSKNIYLLYDYSAQTTQIKKKKKTSRISIHTLQPQICKNVEKIYLHLFCSLVIQVVLYYF